MVPETYHQTIVSPTRVLFVEEPLEEGKDGVKGGRGVEKVDPLSPHRQCFLCGKADILNQLWRELTHVSQ